MTRTVLEDFGGEMPAVPVDALPPAAAQESLNLFAGSPRQLGVPPPAKIELAVVRCALRRSSDAAMGSIAPCLARAGTATHRPWKPPGARPPGPASRWPPAVAALRACTAPVQP